MKFENIYKKYDGHGMESSAYKTPEFVKFVDEFRRGLNAGAKERKWTVLRFSVGHFDVSGHIRRTDGACLYFSVGDLRDGNALNRVLYRFAKSEKDYTGGTNRYCGLFDLWEAMATARFGMADAAWMGYKDVSPDAAFNLIIGA